MPVSTRVLPASGPSASRGSGPSSSNWRPCSRRRAISSRESPPRRASRRSARPGSGPMPGTSAICSGVASSSASMRAEVAGERARVGEADALDAEAEQHAGERPLLRALDRLDQVAGRDLGEALQLLKRLGVEVVDARDPVDQPVLEELADPLLAQPLDVHRAAAHELLDRLEQLARAAGAVGADRPHAVRPASPSACRTPGSSPAPSAAASGSCASAPSRSARPRAGSRRPRA